MNYLARLGWSHGDEEMFTHEQLVEWFDLKHISHSPARFNSEKLDWLNQQYLKTVDDARLAELVRPLLQVREANPDAGGPPLSAVVALLKTRANQIPEIADAAVYFYRTLQPTAELKAQHLTAETLPALRTLAERLQSVVWSAPEIGALLKAVAAEHGLKMGQVGIPMRVAVCGETQTPSLDVTLQLIGRDTVLSRLKAQIG